VLSTSGADAVWRGVRGGVVGLCERWRVTLAACRARLASAASAEAVQGLAFAVHQLVYCNALGCKLNGRRDACWRLAAAAREQRHWRALAATGGGAARPTHVARGPRTCGPPGGSSAEAAPSRCAATAACAYCRRVLAAGVAAVAAALPLPRRAGADIDARWLRAPAQQAEGARGAACLIRAADNVQGAWAQAGRLECLPSLCD
jgi:hypothetical protein